jgi:benzoylformate decarboxylase
MIVLAGEAGLNYEALDGQMAGDLVSMARPFVKSDHNGPCSWRAVDAGSILRLIRRAYKTAATPPMGPVFLSLPMDVLDAENPELVEKTSLVKSVVAPDDKTVGEAATLLAEASRPLILMGDGIVASGAQQELMEVAELLGATVWGANSSEVNMPASHRLYGGSTGHMFGKDSKPILSAADRVLICGTTVLPEVFPFSEGVFAENAKVIHFDLNATELAKNFTAAVAALADPKASLALLAKALSDKMTGPQMTAAQQRCKDAEARKTTQLHQALAKDNADTRQVPMPAFRFFKELGDRLVKVKNQQVAIFDEALTSSPELCRYLPRAQDEYGSYFQTRAGMLGTGLPGTVGLKLARPESIVFGFSGDGGSISTIQALATAARYGIGAKFVVCNNRSYRILKYNLKEWRQEQGLPLDEPYPDSFDLTVADPAMPQLRFDLLAQGHGVNAVRVERPEEIGPALDKALQDDKPFLIDLVISGDL